MPDKVTILIIDDDKDMLETLSDILQEKGYSTETAKTGKEALKKVEERFFNIALIDIRLPDITGIEVLRTFTRKHPSTMPIMMTGNATLQNAVDALNLGANAYITKPIDYEKLDQIINECLEKQEIFILRGEIPASLRTPEIRSMLRAVKEGKITEFIPSFSYEKGIFYPEIEKVLPDPSMYHSVFEKLEKYGIIKRAFYDSVAVCPSCDSPKISIRFRCQSCESANIDRGTAIEHLHCGNIDMHEKFVKGKKLICPKCGEELRASNADYRKPGILFKCHDCGNIMAEPKHEYTCEDCGKSHTLSQLNVKKTFAFIISRAHRTLINKWVKDFDDILESAREFYREVSPPYDKNRPKVSYSAAAKKGETIRYGREE
jgi:CheY-like chemotaxis protein/predicted RNA-binding Zn-ribbon protein involved in translation (DUF1610 family)